MGHPNPNPNSNSNSKRQRVKTSNGQTFEIEHILRFIRIYFNIPASDARTRQLYRENINKLIIACRKEYDGQIDEAVEGSLEDALQKFLDSETETEDFFYFLERPNLQIQPLAAEQERAAVQAAAQERAAQERAAQERAAATQAAAQKKIYELRVLVNKHILALLDEDIVYGENAYESTVLRLRQHTRSLFKKIPTTGIDWNNQTCLAVHKYFMTILKQATLTIFLNIMDKPFLRLALWRLADFFGTHQDQYPSQYTEVSRIMGHPITLSHLFGPQPQPETGLLPAQSLKPSSVGCV